MNTWFTLEPRDVLLVRDGRAMNGAMGRSLPVPHLPTLGGLVRTRLGRRPDGSFDTALIPELLEVGVTGPLLARLEGEGEQIAEVLAPAPADCIWFGPPTSAHRLRALRAAEIVSGGQSDLAADTLLAGFGDAPPFGKPLLGARWWRWSALLDWLTNPPSGQWTRSKADVEIEDFRNEQRTHVSIDAGSRTAADGALFQTRGRRLATFRSAPDAARTVDRYALLGRVRSTTFAKLESGLVPLGGERNAAFLRTHSAPAVDCPPAITKLARGSIARVVLLTPGIFAEGSVPESIHGARVVAAKVDRPEVVSGWDFAKNLPKPTRRMAPAGSVYWVEVPHDGWGPDAWFEPATHDDDRQDGFGLTAVGVA